MSKKPVLIVFCRPAQDSLLAEMARRVETSLRERGREVDFIDLYALRFAPVTHEEEWRAHRRTERPEDGLETHVSALWTAQALVVIYSTWWLGMPAMLKGWMVRSTLAGEGDVRGEGRRVSCSHHGVHQSLRRQ